MKKVFLSHRGSDKVLVRQFRDALTSVGLECWLDEAMIPAGAELDRQLLQGMHDSCGVVFFITPDFEPSDYIRNEIAHALREKRERGEDFAIVTLSFANSSGKRGVVPDPLKEFVWKEPISSLDAFREIVRALPLKVSVTSHLRSAPAFWRPFLAGPTHIIIARHHALDQFEASGTIGFGCAMGLNEVQRYLRQFSSDPPVKYHDRITGEELHTNVISIGGPDANSVTREILSRVKTTVRFGNPEIYEIALLDSPTGHRYLPRYDQARRLTTDYGVIVRAPNPFHRDSAALVLAGSFGFGTWGAAQAASCSELLSTSEAQGRNGVECLIETDIVKDSVQPSRIKVLRELSAPW